MTSVLKFLVRAITWVAIGIFAILVAAVAMHYLFGMRVVLDGGGGVTLRFPASLDEQARGVEAHRQAQRAAADAAANTAVTPATPSAPAAPAASAPLGSAAPTSVAFDPIAPDWTAFRGPARDGVYPGGPIRTDWPVGGLSPVWKQPIGGGYASFAIARGRAFTIEQRGPREVAAAYDVATGRELWTNSWAALFQEFMGGDGPRATPTWSDGVVYVLGATGELRALDEATGATKWRANILDDSGTANLPWGMSASPLIVDNAVVVHPGPIVAYDRGTGAQLWSAQHDRSAYVAPMLVTLNGVRQILVVSASRMMGVTPDRGTLLWEYPWRTQNDINAAQPIVIGDRRVFISSAYGTGAAVIEIARAAPAAAATGASGGVSSFGVREVWRNVRLKNRFNSSVLHDGYLYGFDEAIFACVDAATGDLKWKGGRYGYGQVLLAGGHLIVLTESGELALLRATPERHDELGRFDAIAGKTWNVPAMSRGILLVRNLAEMAAFDLNVR